MTAVASQSLSRRQAETLLRGQRWFSGGERMITAAHWHDVTPLPGGDYRLCVVKVEFDDGSRHANTVVVDDTLQDCANQPKAQAALFEFAVAQQAHRGSHGVFEPTWIADASEVRSDASTLQSLSAEQSNSSFVIDNRYVFKLIRQVHAGPNPEVELLQTLVARSFLSVPRFCGSIEYRSQEGERLDLAVLTAKIDNAEDGWRLACADPDRIAGLVASLGTTLADLHNTLGAQSENDALAPKPFGEEERDRLTRSITRLAQKTEFARGHALHDALGALPTRGGTCMRVHGDLHLGQTLVQGDSWYFLDFEGEPTRSLEERRAKTSPLKDVAGMLRSFSYAEASSGRAGLATRLREPFVAAYRNGLNDALRPPEEHFLTLLAWYEIEKALYELDYEKRYRPSWVHIPRSSLAMLCDQVLPSERDAPTTKIDIPPEPEASNPEKGDA